MIETLPASAYVSPDVYERERHEIFGRQWQLAGFRAQLAAPGDYVMHEFAGWNVAVVVQDDGSLRAFHNVCRHRAGPLVVDDAGHCSGLVCRYHGWAYGRDGALRAARDFGAEVDGAEFSLLALAVDEWRGLVFVNLDPGADALADDHGAFFAAAADQQLEALHYSHRVVHDVAANWKTYCDNYGEGYHVPLVHSQLNRDIDAKRYRVDVGDHFCEHSAPPRQGSAIAGKWLWRYPNLALNVYPDGMNVERFVPTGPQHTQIVYDFFFRDLHAAETNAEAERIANTLLHEDRMICEIVQHNLASGAYRAGMLSPRHEHGLAAFQGWVRESLGS